MAKPLDALAYGRRLGEALLRRQRAQAVRSRYDFLPGAVAAILDTLSTAEPDQECVNLLHTWAWDTYWGLEVRKWLPRFAASFGRLRDLNASQRHPLVWGDYSAWVEPHQHCQIVAVHDHAVCRDDDTYLFIQQHHHFHARTVWPRQQTCAYGKRNWPHDACWRDIARPSLQTYRQRQWQLGYGDVRDTGYAFSLDTQADRTNRVAGALEHHGKIIAALRVLASIEYGLAHPYHVPQEARGKKEDTL